MLLKFKLFIKELLLAIVNIIFSLENKKVTFKIQTRKTNFNDFHNPIDSDRKSFPFFHNYLQEIPFIIVDPGDQIQIRFVIGIPSINPLSIYAGIAMIISFAGELLRISETKVVFLVTDDDYNNTIMFKKFVENELAINLDWSRVSIEIVSRRERKFGVTKKDIFIVTAWWSYYAFKGMIEQVSAGRFIYFIQDYESMFYSYGFDFSQAEKTYEKDFYPIFSTHYLRDFFSKRDKRFINSNFYNLRLSNNYSPKRLSFYQNSEREKRILIYARPTVERNMFSLIKEIFINAIRFNPNILNEFSIYLAGQSLEDPFFESIGAKVLNKMTYTDYRSFLGTVDIGVSLMYSPHPSYPPLEMASSGAIVLTNKFPNRDISELSKNIVTFDIDLESGIEALMNCIELSKDFSSRILNSNFEYRERSFLDHNTPEAISEFFKQTS